MQLGQLILGKRLRRKQIQRPRRRILEDGTEHRRVVAKRLARRSWRRNHDVAPGERVRDGRGLVRVEPVDAAGAEDLPETAVYRVGEGRVFPARAGIRRTAVTQPSGLSGRSEMPPVRRSTTDCRV